ncbi:MAG: stretch-activated cation channel mid1 [Bathelium mastoideum]|nr:MAG: stretch-activated cation channel mid1 [Bathelium mastoideum]
MRFPKLTPLQSRFAASMLASIIILVIYYMLSNPHFAYAAELDSIQNQDHNHHRLPEDLVVNEVHWGEDEDKAGHEPVDEKELRTRREKRQDDASSLDNNVPADGTIKPGALNQYKFSNSTIFGPAGEKGAGFPSPMFTGSSNQADNGSGLAQVASPRNAEWTSQITSDESRKVFISITTCSQPSSSNGSPPPQLTLYVSTSPNPGPTNHLYIIPLTEGWGSANLTGTGDIYMAVQAPNEPSSVTSEWSYQLAASIDGFYHSYSDSQSLLLLDTDSDSALFVSNNLTNEGFGNASWQEWMSMWPPPFTLFAHNINDSSIDGIRYSYCGLQKYAQIQPDAAESGQLVSSMTTKPVGTWGSGPEPKQQFYLNNLNGSSTYWGVMAMSGNSTQSGKGVVNGGGQVWRFMEFTTKSDGNCQLLFNLTTCPNLAHAVPTSPQYLLDTPGLMALYDDAAAALLQNFTYSLAQIPCNTTQTAQYSLARTCEDCRVAYRDWLCAVTIPRCADFSAPPSPYLQPRNVNPGSLFTFPNPLNNFASPVVGANATIPATILDPTTYVPMSSAPAAFPFTNQSLANALSANASRNALAACGANLSAANPLPPPYDANGFPTTCGIDHGIQPGPYNELLPCADYCYELVRACPASLGFACPTRGRGLERSYGMLNSSGGTLDENGQVMCSFDGVVMSGVAGVTNAAGRMGGGEIGRVGVWWLGVVGAMVVGTGMTMW